MEHKHLRLTAAALMIGCLLGCALTVSQATKGEAEHDAPLIGETDKARVLVAIAVPPCHNYGAPYVQTRLHPVSVAAAMMLFSVFGLSVFPVNRRCVGASE